MYDYDTDNFLRNEIEQARRYRLEQKSKLAGHQTNVDKCKANIASADRRLTDLERLLAFHTGQAGTACCSAAEMFEHDPDCETCRDDETPTVTDMRAIFGEPVQGRDYNVMPARDAESEA